MYSLCVILKKPKVKIRYNKFECGFYKKDNMIIINNKTRMNSVCHVLITVNLLLLHPVFPHFMLH